MISLKNRQLSSYCIGPRNGLERVHFIASYPIELKYVLTTYCIRSGQPKCQILALKVTSKVVICFAKLLSSFCSFF